MLISPPKIPVTTPALSLTTAAVLAPKRPDPPVRPGCEAQGPSGRRACPGRAERRSAGDRWGKYEEVPVGDCRRLTRAHRLINISYHAHFSWYRRTRARAHKGAAAVTSTEMTLPEKTITEQSQPTQPTGPAERACDVAYARNGCAFSAKYPEAAVWSRDEAHVAAWRRGRRASCVHLLEAGEWGVFFYTNITEIFSN